MDTLLRAPAIVGLLGIAFLCMAAQPAKPTQPVKPAQATPTAQPAAPAQDTRDSLGMTKAMRDRLNAINKNKSTTVKQLHDSLNAAIEDLRTKTDAKAPDNDISALLSTVKLYMRSIQSDELFYWDSLAAFLTPPQVAAVFLKSHPPKNQSPAPAPAVVKPQTLPAQQNATANPANVMSEKDWKAYIALTPNQQDKLNAANKTKGTTLGSLRTTRDNDIETLRSKMNAHSPDTDIQAAFSTVKSDIKAISDGENGFWDTVAAFLSQTQVAKLFLKGHPKK
jgi:Spy/CpxP family protein refolding chaperone